MSCYTTPHCVCCCTAGFNTLPLSRDCCIPLQQSHRPCVKHILNQCLFRLHARLVWVMQISVAQQRYKVAMATFMLLYYFFPRTNLQHVAHCVCCSLRFVSLLLIAFVAHCVSATQRSTPTHRIARYYILMTTDVVPFHAPKPIISLHTRSSRRHGLSLTPTL